MALRGKRLLFLVFITALTPIQTRAFTRGLTWPGGSPDFCLVRTPYGGLINLRPIVSHTQQSSVNTTYHGVHFSFNPCPGQHNTSASSQPMLVASVTNSQTNQLAHEIVLGTTETSLPPKYNTHNICHKRRLSSSDQHDCALSDRLRRKTSPTETVRTAHVEPPTAKVPGGGLDISLSDEDLTGSGDWSEDSDERVERRRIPTFPANVTAVLRFRNNKGQCKGMKSFILLQCERNAQKSDILFELWKPGMCPGHMYFVLRHSCCCVGACPINTSLESTPASPKPLDLAFVDTSHGVHPDEGYTTEEFTQTSVHNEGITARVHTASAHLGRTNKARDRPSWQDSGLESGEMGNLLEWLQERGFSGSNLSEVQDYIHGMFDLRADGEPHTVADEVLGEVEESPRFMWLIVVVNMGVIGAAICIAGLCCRKGTTNTTHGPYGYLPDLGQIRTQALHSSRLTLASSVESFFPQTVAPPAKSAEYLDYSSPLAKSSKLPQLDNCVIDSVDLDIGQRLGGGLFGDTYLGEWKDRPVAAKRLTVGVHQGQMDDADRKWIIAEVQKISHQRHRSLVAVFGVCMDTRQPYLVSEFIECESLRDHLTKKNDTNFNWSKKIKIMTQVADGLAYLHSAKPPVLHRDLRCANILIDRNDKVKVVDHGMTKITQRLRQGCSGRKGCFCQKEFSALPASIRWTAPELLSNPTADEEEHNIITPECDVYSYGMVLWETASHCEPFEDIPDDNEVRELVVSNMRPRVDILVGLIPHLKELMVSCWDGDPEARPTFKEIITHLKTCQQVLTKMSHKPRTRNNSSTTYLKSTLNMPS